MCPRYLSKPVASLAFRSWPPGPWQGRRDQTPIVEGADRIGLLAERAAPLCRAAQEHSGWEFCPQGNADLGSGRDLALNIGCE